LIILFAESAILGYFNIFSSEATCHNLNKLGLNHHQDMYFQNCIKW